MQRIEELSSESSTTSASSQRHKRAIVPTDAEATETAGVCDTEASQEPTETQQDFTSTSIANEPWSPQRGLQGNETRIRSDSVVPQTTQDTYVKEILLACGCAWDINDEFVWNPECTIFNFLEHMTRRQKATSEYTQPCHIETGASRLLNSEELLL